MADKSLISDPSAPILYLITYGFFCYLILQFAVSTYTFLGELVGESSTAFIIKFIELMQYLSASLAPTFILAGLFTLLELQTTRRKRIATTYTLSFVNLLLSFGGFAVFLYVFENLLGIFDYEPIFDLSQSKYPLVVTYSVVLAHFFVSDVLLYWVHRAEHKNKFLWYLHKVHHAVEDMDSVSGAFHPLSNIIRWCLTLLPLNFIITINLADALILSSFLSGVHFVQHTRAPLHFGWFGKVIGDNRFHFLHHSKEPKYYNKNFAAIFPVIDMIFGTYVEPDKYILPDTGLSHLKGAANVKEFLSGQLESRR